MTPIQSTSIFADIPTNLVDELCQTIGTQPHLRIERIVSQGHASPAGFWYDQPQDEWVLVVQGQARLAFADEADIELNAGDYLLIPAYCRHRVAWTDPEQTTIWLALHIVET